MSRVLFLGDLAGTGFGTVTKDLGLELLKRGEDVRVISMNAVTTLEEPYAAAFEGRVSTVLGEDGWLRVPYSLADHEANVASYRGMFNGATWPDRWAPEAVIVCGDVASFKQSAVLEHIPDGLPAFHYVPVEGIGLPPRWGGVWRRFQPVAMCRFGADEIAKLTGSQPPIVYHGVNTDAFYPVSRERPIVWPGKELIVLRSKADCRRAFGIPDEAIVLFRADRNMPRKMYPSLFRALAPMLAHQPKAMLWWHCRTVDEGGDLADERSKYPPHIAGRMFSSGLHDEFGGAPRVVLAAMYNAADIYVSNSSEGFGLTIAESLACGVPVVGMDYSSVPEVIGAAGTVVPIAGLVDNIYSHFWGRVDEPAFGKAVEFLITHRQSRLELGFLGPLHVARNFTWQKAAEQFSALIADATKEAVAA